MHWLFYIMIGIGYAFAQAQQAEHRRETFGDWSAITCMAMWPIGVAYDLSMALDAMSDAAQRQEGGV